MFDVDCSDPPDDPVAVNPLTVWWVTPPVLSSVQPLLGASWYSRLGPASPSPSGRSGRRPGGSRRRASTSLRVLVHDPPAAVAVEHHVDVPVAGRRLPRHPVRPRRGSCRSRPRPSAPRRGPSAGPVPVRGLDELDELVLARRVMEAIRTRARHAPTLRLPFATGQPGCWWLEHLRDHGHGGRVLSGNGPAVDFAVHGPVAARRPAGPRKARRPETPFPATHPRIVYGQAALLLPRDSASDEFRPPFCRA